MTLKHEGRCKEVHLKSNHQQWEVKARNSHGYHNLMKLDGFHSLDGKVLKEPCLVCLQEK